ncbi:MAG: hypothetical protein GY777_20695 [Candidatus Brocadiaceae bacterium]|nr:hypothetical protein [Candidatus Brocadiaceae bacterium]
MPELKELTNSFDKTLKDSDLQNVTTSLSEVALDSLMEDGITKDIPVIGTIVGAGKFALGIRERLFLKKIIYFISELKIISTTKRLRMIEIIDSSQKYRIKVGEKLLYIIEKCDDYEKSQIIARLFSAFIEKIITYDEFLRSAAVVERIDTEDLMKFVNDDWDRLNIDEAGEYLNSGLAVLESPEIYVEDQWDHKVSDKYIVNGAELTAYISTIGLVIRKLL